ncbi:MAG: MFS transporter [Bryobacteraceae bacterium]
MAARQVYIVALLLGFSLLTYIDRTILSVSAPSIVREFHFSEIEMGWIFSAFQIAYTLAMTPGGRWADRFGPRRVLAAHGLGSGALTAALAVVSSFPLMMALRAGFGVFTAPIYPAAGRMNSNWMPERLRTSVQSIVHSGAGLGGAISPILFTWMIAALGWRASFVAAGAVTVAFALLWYVSVADHPAGEHAAAAPPPAPPSRWRELLGDRNLQLLTIGFAALDYFEYIFFYWLYYYLGEIRKLPQAETAAYTTMPFVAWLVMMPIGGRLADVAVARMGAQRGLRAMAISFVALSAGCLFGALAVEPILAVVTLLSLALGFCAIADVIFWAAAIRISGRHVGAACGIMNTGGNLGGSLAPVLTPLIASAFGWSAGLWVGGAVALVGVACWLFVDSDQRVELRDW